MNKSSNSKGLPGTMGMANLSIMTKLPTEDAVGFLNRQRHYLLALVSQPFIPQDHLNLLIQVVATKLCSPSHLWEVQESILCLITTREFLQTLFAYTNHLGFYLQARNHRHHYFPIHIMEYMITYYSCAYITMRNTIPSNFPENVEIANNLLNFFQIYVQVGYTWNPGLFSDYACASQRILIIIDHLHNQLMQWGWNLRADFTPKVSIQPKTEKTQTRKSNVPGITTKSMDNTTDNNDENKSELNPTSTNSDQITKQQANAAHISGDNSNYQNFKNSLAKVLPLSVNKAIQFISNELEFLSKWVSQKRIQDASFAIFIEVVGTKLCKTTTSLMEEQKKIMTIITTPKSLSRMLSYTERLFQPEEKQNGNSRNNNHSILEMLNFQCNYYKYLVKCVPEKLFPIPIKDLIQNLISVSKLLKHAEAQVLAKKSKNDLIIDLIKEPNLEHIKSTFTSLEKQLKHELHLEHELKKNDKRTASNSKRKSRTKAGACKDVNEHEPDGQMTILQDHVSSGETKALSITNPIQKIIDQVEKKSANPDKRILPGKNISSQGQEENAKGKIKELEFNSDYSFVDIDEVPSKDEVSAKKGPPLKPMPFIGNHDSAWEYLENQYHLLREDLVTPIRNFISKPNSMISKVPKMTLYYYMKLYPEAPSSDSIYKSIDVNQKNRRCCTFHFYLPRLTEEEWEDSDHLLPESLVVLSADNFETIYIATVTNRNKTRLANGLVTVTWEGPEPEPRILQGRTFTMAESQAYFVSYRYTLKALQEMARPIPPNYDQPLFATYPMAKYIVNMTTNHVPPPRYLLNTNPNELYNFSILTKTESFETPPLEFQLWPTSEELGMDVAQYKAFRSAVTEELSIIQGPPGTGKTYIGLQLMKLFLSNPQVINFPILIVCRTNHALDQFLEGVLPIMVTLDISPHEHLLRVGGGSESLVMMNYTVGQHRIQKDLNQFGIGSAATLLLSASDGVMKANIGNGAGKVIGMTTTGAAKYATWVRLMKPRIVIAEEAAEVLESHIVTSITEHCEHLILIGDHKQLRPLTTVYTLAKNYHLDISLFERLINNNLRWSCLETQHRMRPEICSMLVPTIYSKLENHPCVLNYPIVAGFTRNLFFIDHEENEDVGKTEIMKLQRVNQYVQEVDSATRCNSYEAHYVVTLGRHLLLQGYKPNQITILNMYKGQKLLVEEIIKSYGSTLGLEEMKVETVDSYQGEENDIIIVSLVRGNADNCIGFLATENRICVALSRARHGLYMIGNMNTLLNSKTVIWARINEKLREIPENKSIGEELELKCQVHNKVYYIRTPDDFKTETPDGGCNKPCKAVLRCKHRCQKHCHVVDKDHLLYQCQIPVLTVLKCGHVNTIVCHTVTSGQLNDILCTFKCDTKLECGHVCEAMCHEWSTPGLCHAHDSFLCKQLCIRRCEQNHLCGNFHLCFQQCPPCNAVVNRLLPCGCLATGIPCHVNPVALLSIHNCRRREELVFRNEREPQGCIIG